MYRLDGVDPEVRGYFTPVAKMVLASRNPQEAMEVGARLPAWLAGWLSGWLAATV